MPGILDTLKARLPSGATAPETEQPGGLLSRLRREKPEKTDGGEKTADMEITLAEDHTFEANGKTVATGLFWVPRESGKRLKDQARDAAENGIEVDTALVLGGTQVAFGDSDKGQKAGVPAAATALSRAALGEAWIAAFRLGDIEPSWWIVAMRDGYVFEDRVLHDTEEAIQTFGDQVTEPGWERRICPADWTIPETEDVPLSRVWKSKSAQKLRSLNRMSKILPRAAAAVVLLGVLIFGYNYMQTQKALERERQAEIAAMKRERITVNDEDYPWYLRTEVADFAAACARTIEDNIHLATGWDLMGAECDADAGSGTVSYTYSRAGGKYAYLVSALPPEMGRPRISPGGDAARISVGFDVPVIDELERGDKWVGPRIDTILGQRFETLGISQMLETRSRERQLTVVQESNLSEPVFNGMDIELRTPMAITQIVRLLTDIPGLVSESINYSFADGVWSYTGRAYYEPIMPTQPPI